jgi:chromosome segregation ATPase
MKTKIGMVVLAVACVVLAIAWFATKKQMETLRDKDVTIIDFSNQLVNASKNLDELRQVNLALTNDLAASRQEALAFSNQSTEAAGALASTKASLQSAQEQIANLNGRVADMEAQNLLLDQRAAALTNTIAGLNAQIAATQQKLADAETNNAFLEKELQRQTAAKAQWERKFNDLDQVRAQVKKLRDDLLVARRLQWARAGFNPTSPQKGAQLLVQRRMPVSPTPLRPPRYDLNVEVGSDGSIRIIPPPTNAPAPTTNRPPQ